MSKSFKDNFSKLRNIGKFDVINQIGVEKENEGNRLKFLTIENKAAGPSVSTLEIKTITNSSYKNLQNIINLFDSIDLKEELEDKTTVLFLKIHVSDLFDGLNSEVIEEISRKCFKKSIVIFVTSENCDKSLIYWKSKDIQQLITLKHYKEEFTENDSKIYKFVADYLAKSLSRGELGLNREYSTGSEVGAHLLTDTRDYNLLLIAAESGNSEIVKILQKFGFNTVADDGVSAQDLAWKHRHSEVLIVLSQANLTYPDGIDITQLSDDFKTFYKNTEELHAAIIEKNEEKVKQILNCDKKLEFHFDLSNKSAARVAVDAKAFNIYEILVIHEIFLAPHEYQQGIFDNLQYAEQKLIRELHHKHSKDLPDRHINILMAHSSIAHDAVDTGDKLKYVLKAYKHLSKDSRLSTILKVVAASKKFQIIYDFKRDAVNIADPTTSGNTEGVFYPMGRIYIGARQLLDEGTRSQAIGTLAHELCHFAANLVYSNQANPYKRNDKQTLQEFEEINEKCQKEKGKEEIVDIVHECYPVDMHHAELIVRPAHLIAMYQDQPEKLAELDQTFPHLFEFFDKIIKEMEAAIPEIKRRVELEIEKKDHKISRLRKKLVLCGLFSVIAIIAVAAIVGIIFYKPLYNFKDLSQINKLKVTNGPIIYKNIEVRFHDLFPDNSTAYSKLTSDHISQILDGQALDFTDPNFLYLNDLVYHNWTNLTEILKQKFLTSNYTFQNESLKIQKLAEINSNFFKSLSSEQIVDVLDGKKLVIGKTIEDQIGYYIERRFVVEDVKVLGGRNKLRDGVEVVGRKIVTEDEEKRHQNESKEVKHKTLNDIDIKDSDEVINAALNETILILNSEIGDGKTVIFKVFAMRIKRKFPTRWVSYIDLEKRKKILSFFEQLKMFDDVPDIYSNKVSLENNSYKLASISDDLEDLSKKLALDSELYSENLLNASRTLTEISENLILNHRQCNRYTEISLFSNDNIENNQIINDLIEFIGKIIELDLKSKFEKEIFEYYFRKGDVIILWDNAHISSENRKMMTNVFNLIFKLTKNVQFISTMPLLVNQLKQSLNCKIYHPVPFTESEQKSFFRGFFMQQNFPKEKIENFTQGAFNISKTLQLDSLLLQKFIADIYEPDKLYESPNFYNLVLKFATQKIKTFYERRDPSKTLANYFISRMSNFNIYTPYERLVFEMELDLKLCSKATPLEYKHFNDLQILKIKIPNNVFSLEDMSRMEILSFNSGNDYKFRHKTIAVFFFAKYFIDNLYLRNSNVDETETNLRVQVFKYVVTNYDGIKMMRTLIEHYKRSAADIDYKNEDFDEILNGSWN